MIHLLLSSCAVFSERLYLLFFFFLMIRRPPRSTLSSSSAASDVYKRQGLLNVLDSRLDKTSFSVGGGGHPPLQLTQLTQHQQSQSSPQQHHQQPLHATNSIRIGKRPVSYTHLRAHETPEHLVCRLLLEKKKKKTTI
eukprot:TRINITY_DN16760_c0_g1_i3.p1 TRINITY_DN16760_c0_g1~~TRINITY_DN16760_c0_g1_i3.p1  ORF type:complete len:138 (+),score=44.41 TRINITY_DN16760_c0_g1_i3:20-433(+)